ncbi:uncharacterized protein LOC119640133 [Glossina fuscipes]|uniref:Uncharacterized protein LOC119640133 n=1 Tax=Glossina fuscipes TaxID=7396 RepID=A0A9C6DWD1_9MUSC|nr:uncharacterized protein LOC119640133 [Glossina fuscipes]KAI9579158.1 hypothetical protein GQX74_014775 [Glossina fuscipes]
MTSCPNNHRRCSYSYFTFISFVYIVTIRFGFASTSLDPIKEEVNPRMYNDSEQIEISTTVSPSLKHLAQCGNTQRMVDNCFRDLPPHLMAFLQSKKPAINKNEVLSKCKVFERGMECFDEYTARCLPHTNLNILQNNVEGAKHFFNKFCGDREFQSNYLKHKDCLSYIQDDWMRCTKSFQIILTEELYMENKNVTQKFMEFCCARHAYETCIYNSARYKCYKHSAKFAREAAKMLTDEKHFSNCRQYEAIMCNGRASLHRQYWQHCWHCWLMLLVLCRLFLPTYRLITH